MLDFYLILRSVLKAKPHLRPGRCRCTHGRIFFLTDLRNAGRRDLGCPFGCREAHRKPCSTERSAEYYRDSAGKDKKQDPNRKRTDRAAARRVPEPEKENPPAGDESAVSPEADLEPWHPPMVEYVRMAVSWIEGRRVRREEVLEMLARRLRPPRMVRRRNIDQAVAGLHANPP